MVEWLCPYWPSKILFWIIWKTKILSCCLLYKWFSSSKETEWTKQKMVVCVPKQKRFTGLLIRKIAVLLPDLVITIYLFELLWKEYLTFLHLQRRKTCKHGQEKWACARYQHRWFSRMSGSSCTQCDLWISHILRGLFFSFEKNGQCWFMPFVHEDDVFFFLQVADATFQWAEWVPRIH